MYSSYFKCLSFLRMAMILSTFALTSCGYKYKSVDTISLALNKLTNQKSLWKSIQNNRDYTFQYKENCFCYFNYSQPNNPEHSDIFDYIEVSVRGSDDQIVSAKLVHSDNSETILDASVYDQLKTVDAIFDSVNRSISSIRNSSYPSTFEIVYDENIFFIKKYSHTSLVLMDGDYIINVQNVIFE